MTPTKRSPSIWLLCLATLAALAACGEEDAANDAANNGNNGLQNNGEVNNGAVNNGAVNNGAVNNGAVNNGAENNGEVERPACEVVEPAEVAEAVYDAYLLPPLEEFVDELQYLEATVRRDGEALTVVVGDDEIPAVFETQPGLEHCVANPDAAILKLCFYQASGEPARPGALGAVFRPLGASLFAVAAHRRGVARPCTPAGHYDLQVDSLDDGGAPFASEAVEALLDYLGFFVIDGQGAALLGDEPRVIAVSYEDGPLTFAGALEGDVLVTSDGAEWDLDMEIQEGRFVLEPQGASSVQATVALSLRGEGAQRFVIRAEVSGQRR
jgi:hypothetical protein